MAKVLGKPSSILAMLMFFARVAPGQGQIGGVSGRARSSYLATLGTDLKYLYSGEVDPTTASLDYLVVLAGASGGPCSVKKVLAELQPDEVKGDSVVSVCRRTKDVCCEVAALWRLSPFKFGDNPGQVAFAKHAG